MEFVPPPTATHMEPFQATPIANDEKIVAPIPVQLIPL